MADEGLIVEAWSMPHVGSLTRKFTLQKNWIESAKFNDRFNDLCDGELVVTDDLPTVWRDKFFKIDEANHANDAGSMIRVLRGTTPLMHFMVTRAADTWSDTSPTQTFTLEGLEWLLDRATVPHYDHPADPTVDPDWIYGADTVLGNPSLEASPASMESQFLSHTQASGTYTITYSGQTTSALAFNADWFAVSTALEALSNIQDVTVSGAGTLASPFVIEFRDPSGNVAQITSTATGANIGTYTQGGILDPGPWTTSFNPSTGEAHGLYTTFAVSSAQAHTGTSSLLVNAQAPANPADFPGVQQIMNVTPGRTYRANIWVRPTFSSTFRLVIRTMDETFIAQSASDGVALTANVWTQLVIDPFIIPAHVTQIIYRLGLIDSTDRGDWYVDDGLLAPGFPEATLGEIMDDIFVAMQAQGVLLWLTPSWTRTHDSDGVLWDRDLKWFVNHDQTLYQLLEYARRWNYESRPTRWDVADARFEWDMWNPSGGGQTRANIAITGKSGVSSSGPIVKKPPDFTYMRVEGERGRWGEFASSTLDDVWGRLEKTQADRQGVDSPELDQFAERIVTRGQDRTGSRSVQVEDPSILPWTAYEPGDIVTLTLTPKDDKKALRIAAIVASMEPGRAAPVYEVHFTTPVLTNDAAMAQGLRTLMRKFDAMRFIPPAATVEPFIKTCCPSCPANAVGVLPATPMVSSFTTLDWQIDNDPDNLLNVDASGGLHLVRPGLYTIHFQFDMSWTLSTAGLTTWRLRSQVGSNDAGQDIKDWLSFRPTTGTTSIQTSFFHYGHVKDPDKTYTFDWSLLTLLSSGVVTAGTGALEATELTVVRHSDGCARDPGSA